MCRQVCSGFVYALTTADNFIKAGQAKHVLVIGAENIFKNIRLGRSNNMCFVWVMEPVPIVLSAKAGVGDNSDQGIPCITHSL